MYLTRRAGSLTAGEVFQVILVFRGCDQSVLTAALMIHPASGTRRLHVVLIQSEGTLD